MNDFLIPAQVGVETPCPSPSELASSSVVLFAYSMGRLTFFVSREASLGLPSSGVLGCAQW